MTRLSVDTRLFLDQKLLSAEISKIIQIIISSEECVLIAGFPTKKRKKFSNNIIKIRGKTSS
jgi:hypothetical protein